MESRRISIALMGIDASGPFVVQVATSKAALEQGEVALAKVAACCKP